jgi:hypothetical protein
MMLADARPGDGPPATDVEKALGVWNSFLYRTDNRLHAYALKYVNGAEADELQAAYNVIAMALRADGPPPEAPPTLRFVRRVIEAGWEHGEVDIFDLQDWATEAAYSSRPRWTRRAPRDAAARSTRISPAPATDSARGCGCAAPPRRSPTNE